MEFSILGKTNREVSRVGFGGATAGLKNYISSFDPEKIPDREPIIAAIKRAYELGINYFDTAASYGDGAGERIFGEGISGLPREKIFLATKASFSNGDKARRSLEQSLINLRTDYVDLIQIHGGCYTDGEAENILSENGMLGAFIKAKEEGLAKHVGLTVECVNGALHGLIREKSFETVQIRYNVMYQDPYDPSFKIGCMYEIERENLGIITMRTASSGIFQRWINEVNPKNDFDYTPALIQTVLSNPLVDVALIGMRTTSEVEHNVKICEDMKGRINLEKLHERYV